jgi:hypothetical protein
LVQKSLNVGSGFLLDAIDMVIGESHRSSMFPSGLQLSLHYGWMTEPGSQKDARSDFQLEPQPLLLQLRVLGLGLSQDGDLGE